MIDYSIIIPVLDSHEVVRRQLIHLGRLLKDRPNWELIIVDDGSSPPLKSIIDNRLAMISIWHHFINKRFTIEETEDYRPWTQPRARNRGYMVSRGDWLLFTDIDHILTESVLWEAENTIKDNPDYDGEVHYLMKFQRQFGELDEGGNIVGNNGIKHYHHPNTFLIDRLTFGELYGYDEDFCGRHGGDDLDFLSRFRELPGAIEAMSPEHVYLIPQYVAEFHKLERE